MVSRQTLPEPKMKMLGLAATVFLLMTVIFAYIGNVENRNNGLYVGLSSQLLMLSQRFVNEAQQASSGSSTAFDELAAINKQISSTLSRLDQGDDILSATKGAARTELDRLMTLSGKTMQDVQVLENGRVGLVALGNTVAAIKKTDSEFRELSQTMIDKYSGAQKELAMRFAIASERIAKGAGLALGAVATIAQLSQLGVDGLAAKESLAALPAEDAKVVRIRELFENYYGYLKVSVSQTSSLAAAKEASNRVIRNSDAVLESAQRLVDAYQLSSFGRSATFATILFGAAFLLSLVLLAKSYVDNFRQSTNEAMRINRENQDGILRLMNELGDLAEGDLRVRATVTEDITGAIADSVNYTTEEFRKLVARINKAAEQMERSTKDARGISIGLLEAAQKQAGEIQGAGEAVKLMTQSIQEVDTSALKSAEVARRTLEVTQHGAQAVRNTISGMDEIREQIQNTAKRIKRLGESSQEIGEIVDLISDITEQTNVLALNAAIQAASAGEAGRGFSVVAEEVQRLAERSAEATKQIGGLVKTIQGDTHDAVAAMEKSIMGVVAGTELSDMAGNSLQEIEQVSNELATLINNISVSTQMQTDMASEVAEAMQGIFKVTVQTTEGTRLTANSIAQLANLASELRGSVAGFKL